MKKLLLTFSFIIVSLLSLYAQPYTVTIKFVVPLDCNGTNEVVLVTESGAEGKEFLIPERTLPAPLAAFQSYYDVFAGGIIGIEQGALNENVTLNVNLDLLKCSPDNQNLLELVRLSIKVVGDVSGTHDVFTYYNFNTGKKGFIKLKAAKLFAYMQSQGVTLDQLVGWFYAEGFTPDVTGISYKYSESDPEWFYIYLEHFSKIVLGVISSPTDIKSSIVNPTDYKLEQNYPNPFNPVTQIYFALPREGYTQLTVYNSIGIAVKTLISEVKAAGNHNVSFNASDLPSGIYFYELKSGNFTSTRKMIYLK